MIKWKNRLKKFLNPKQIDLFKKLKEKQSGSKKKKNKKEKKEETPIEN